MRKASLVLSLLLVGCTPDTPEKIALTDAQNAARAAYRDQVFEKCMKLLPAGPEQTKYNDWAEVVSECGQLSYYHMNTRFPP